MSMLETSLKLLRRKDEEIARLHAAIAKLEDERDGLHLGCAILMEIYWPMIEVVSALLSDEGDEDEQKATLKVMLSRAEEYQKQLAKISFPKSPPEEKKTDNVSPI